MGFLLDASERNSVFGKDSTKIIKIFYNKPYYLSTDSNLSSWKSDQAIHLIFDLGIWSVKYKKCLFSKQIYYNYFIRHGG